MIIVVPEPDISPEFSDRKSTRLNSSHVRISYAVFCLKKKNIHDTFVDAAKSTESIEFLKDKSNWLIIGNDGLADKFGVDNITMEDFVNGELGEYSEGAKTAEKR